MRRLFVLAIAVVAMPMLPAQEAKDDPKAEYAALLKELRQIQMDHAKAVQAKNKEEEAKNPGQARTAMSFDMRVGIDKVQPRFEAAAAKYAGTDGAVPFLIWLGQNTSKDKLQATLQQLVTEHVTSAELAPAIGMLLGRARRELDATAAAELRAKYMEKAPADGKALLCLSDAQPALGKDPKDPVARAGVAKAIELATDAKIKARAEGVLFAADHLQEGLPVPEIEGTNLEGSAIKLTDFRGKVVLLDFWGDW